MFVNRGKVSIFLLTLRKICAHDVLNCEKVEKVNNNY